MGNKILSKQYRAMRENISAYSMTELHAIIKRVVKSENAFNALTFIDGNYKVKYELVSTQYGADGQAMASVVAYYERLLEVKSHAHD